MEPPDAMLNIKYVYMKSVFRVWGVIEMRVFFFCFVLYFHADSLHTTAELPHQNEMFSKIVLKVLPLILSQSVSAANTISTTIAAVAVSVLIAQQ